MKRFIVLCLTLIVALPLFVACREEKKEEAGMSIVGAWRSKNYSTDDTKRELLYAFTENGHMLAINYVDGKLVWTGCAHFSLIDGVLTIQERGKEDGAMSVGTDGNGNMVLTKKGDTKDFLVFSPEKFKKNDSLLGKWRYEYVGENGEEMIYEYYFKENGAATLTLYENNVPVDKMDISYTTTQDNLLVLSKDGDDGLPAEPTLCAFSFPYENYMLLEEVTDDDDVNGIRVLKKVSS